MTFYDGRGTHHVRNPSRPSPRFSYCKRQKLWWRPGNEASCSEGQGEVVQAGGGGKWSGEWVVSVYYEDVVFMFIT